MPEITFDEADRQIETISNRVGECAKRQDWDAMLAALHALLAHPCAHHLVDESEVWDQVHEAHKRAGDYDAAIAAKEEAIRHGCRSEPDPLADIAECHLLAGRPERAAEIFAELRIRTPDDVWLYNSAGLTYLDASDPDEAARWLRDGIDVAFRTGDPDQVVVQLVELLEAASEAGGPQLEPGLSERVDAFVEEWVRPEIDVRSRWGDLPEREERPCAFCSFDPDRTWAEWEERSRRARWSLLDLETPDVAARIDALPGPRSTERSTGLRGATDLAVAWFPAGEWERAVDRWPDLLEDLPADHAEYSRRIEARIKRIARSAVGHPMHVAPIVVDELVSSCAGTDEDPGTAGGRARYAAEVQQRGDAVPWPPGRNSPCWCGSGRKYKMCCGPVEPSTE